VLNILGELRQERDEARWSDPDISAGGGSENRNKRRGRPPQWMASQEQASAVTLPRRSRKPFSAAIASAIDLWAETIPGLSGHLRRHHIV